MRDFVKALRKNFEAKVKAKQVKLDTSCSKCGRKPEEVKQLELHHVVPIWACPTERGFNPNVQGNLITLCFDCHLAYHRFFEDAYPEERVMEWLRDVPMEEVNRLLNEYRAAREARRRFHTNKHRNRSSFGMTLFLPFFRRSNFFTFIILLVTY